MRTLVTGLLVLAALVVLVAAPVAVAGDDCVAVEKDGVWVYPEGCTENGQQQNPQGNPGG